MTINHEPERTPPSPNIKPPKTRKLSEGEYLIELGNRLESHSKDRVIGVQAKREVAIAGMLLRKFGEEME